MSAYPFIGKTKWRMGVPYKITNKECLYTGKNIEVDENALDTASDILGDYAREPFAYIILNEESNSVYHIGFWCNTRQSGMDMIVSSFNPSKVDKEKAYALLDKIMTKAGAVIDEKAVLNRIAILNHDINTLTLGVRDLLKILAEGE